MCFRAVSVLFLLAGGSLLPAANEWTFASSPNFELITTGGERKAKAGILHFEQVRDFFLRALNFKATPGLPVRLIAFDSPKEWATYRPNEAATAFYLSGMDRDYIAMESLRGEVYPTAVHEYVHLLLRHTGGEFPIWMNEGLAEVYSNMTPVGKKMQVGNIHLGRYQLLQREKWIPMEQLVAVDHDSPLYNRKAHSGMLYSQSWALVHMVLLADAYRPKSGELLTRIAFGRMPAADAFQSVYGKSLFKVQRDLEDYFNGTSFKMFVFDYQQEKPLAPDVRPATAFEADLTLAKLTASASRTWEQAGPLFEALEAKNPTHLELQEAMGFYAMQSRKPEEAVAHFDKAIELGSRNPKLYFQHAFAVRPASVEKSVASMKKSVELDPDNRETRYWLGRLLLEAKKHGEALSTLVQIKPVPAEQAFGYIEALAYCYAHFKKMDDAKLLATRAVQMAKTEPDQLRAKSLAQYVESYGDYLAQREKAEAALARLRKEREEAKPEPEEAPAEPTLVAREPAREDERADTTEEYVRRQAKASVVGRLRMVECRGQKALLTVFADGQMRHFAIDDPGQVSIVGTGRRGEVVEFTCGPQKDLPVVVGYDPTPDARTKTEGAVRTLQFK